MSFKKISVATLTLVPISMVAHSEIYLSQEQAVRQLFPDLKMTLKTFSLTENQQKKIETLGEQKVRDKSVKLYLGPKKEVVFIDQVLGKHEFITYAVGVGADGKIMGVEILEYRETYGQQVKNADWRKQFVGKDSASPLKVEKDIKNISGATLSSAHVTGGVKRLLQTYDILRPSF